MIQEVLKKENDWINLKSKKPKVEKSAKAEINFRLFLLDRDRIGDISELSFWICTPIKLNLKMEFLA